VLGLPKVGAYLTPSYEALVSLHPDLVVTLPEHADIEPHIGALHIPLLRLDHRSIEGVIRSLVTLGEYGGVQTEATRAALALRQHLARVKGLSAGKSGPRVLLVLGRSTDDFRRIYAAGPGSLHDDLITYAGGRNVLDPGAVSYPALSVEGLLRLDPDVILEFAGAKNDAAALRGQWNTLSSLRAVKTGRVFVFTEEFLSVPGPRLVRFTETLAHAFFPGAETRITP
jgi:iron complex transport system substrate-binding protein